MTKNTIFNYVFLSVILLFFFNFIASKLHWYSSMWYFDIFMHIFGGVVLGFFSLWFFYKDVIKYSFSRKIFLKIIFLIFIIGFAWEFYEIIVNNIFARDAFSFSDTVSDLLCDLIGGTIVFIFLKNLYKKNKIMYN